MNQSIHEEVLNYMQSLSDEEFNESTFSNSLITDEYTDRGTKIVNGRLVYYGAVKQLSIEKGGASMVIKDVAILGIFNPFTKEQIQDEQEIKNTLKILLKII